jgi:hypothetical protein
MEKPQGQGFQDRAVKVKARSKHSGGEVGGFSEQGLLTYEQRLARDPRWALSEGSRHFEEKSAVFDALHKITNRLILLFPLQLQLILQSWHDLMRTIEIKPRALVAA